MAEEITREKILAVYDTVYATIRDLTFITIDFDNQLIEVRICGKDITLPVCELIAREKSAKDFIDYLKEKINETD